MTEPNAESVRHNADWIKVSRYMARCFACRWQQEFLHWTDASVAVQEHNRQAAPNDGSEAHRG